MNKFLWLALLFVFSCKQSRNETNHPRSENTTQLPFIPTEEKQKLLAIIHGGWVKEEYIKSHIQTKSPYQSYQLNQSFVELIIDTTNVRGDTLMNPGCHTNGKESYYFKIILELDAANYVDMHMMYNHNYKEQNLFLGYSTSSEDTTLYLIRKDLKTGKVKSKSAYKRIFASPLNNDYAFNPMDVFLNRTILSGKYKIFDDKNKLLSDSAEFNDWGELKGFPGFDHYNIGFDRFDGFNGNYKTDYIRLFSSSEQVAVLGWKKESGGVTFYNLTSSGGDIYDLTSDGGGIWKRSGLRYKLEKRR